MKKNKTAIIILISAVCIIIALIIVFCVLYLQKDENTFNGNSSYTNYDKCNVELDGYKYEVAGYNIKEYAEKNGADMLYYDGYEESLTPPGGGGYIDYVYYDENNEIFCFEEKIYAEEYYGISIFKEDSGVDFSEEAKNFGVKTTEINGVEFEYIYIDEDYRNIQFFAKANYGGYLYVVDLIIGTEEYGVELLAQLFN